MTKTTCGPQSLQDLLFGILQENFGSPGREAGTEPSGLAEGPRVVARSPAAVLPAWTALSQALVAASVLRAPPRTASPPRSGRGAGVPPWGRSFFKCLVTGPDLPPLRAFMTPNDLIPQSPKAQGPPRTS